MEIFGQMEINRMLNGKKVQIDVIDEAIDL